MTTILFSQNSIGHLSLVCVLYALGVLIPLFTWWGVIIGFNFMLRLLQPMYYICLIYVNNIDLANIAFFSLLSCMLFYVLVQLLVQIWSHLFQLVLELLWSRGTDD